MGKDKPNATEHLFSLNRSMLTRFRGYFVATRAPLGRDEQRSETLGTYSNNQIICKVEPLDVSVIGIVAMFELVLHMSFSQKKFKFSLIVVAGAKLVLNGRI